MAYVFGDQAHTFVIRDGDTRVPWNPSINQPAAVGAEAWRAWQLAGSPVPDPYVAPAPTADEARMASFKSDVQRADLITHLRTDTLAQIETFVRNQIAADGVSNIAQAQQCLKRIETAVVNLFKALALVVRD